MRKLNRPKQEGCNLAVHAVELLVVTVCRLQGEQPTLVPADEELGDERLVCRAVRPGRREMRGD